RPHPLPTSPLPLPAALPIFEVHPRGLRGAECDVGIAEAGHDRRDPPQVTQLLGELESGSETADRLPVLAECRLSLSQVNQRGDSRAGILLSLVGSGRAAPARSGLFEGAAGEGLNTLIEKRSSRGLIR